MSFFFLVQNNTNATQTFLIGFSSITGEESNAHPIAAKRNRFGFYRNPMASDGLTVYFPALLDNNMDLMTIDSWDSEPQSTGHIIGRQDGVSDVTLYRNGGVISFFLWSTDFYNDLYTFDVEVSSSILTYSGMNGTYMTESSGRYFFRQIGDFNATVGSCSLNIFVGSDPGLPPTRYVQEPDQDMASIELADQFLPKAFHVSGSFLYYNLWPTGKNPPSVGMNQWLPVNSQWDRFPGLSIAWAFDISATDVGIAGPTAYMATAEEFVNADRFNAISINPSTGPAVVTQLVGSGISHVYSALAFNSTGPRLLYGNEDLSVGPPRAFFRLAEQKGNTGAQLGLTGVTVQCPGLNYWTEYVRFLPCFNGTHAVGLLPDNDLGPSLHLHGVTLPARTPCV